MIERKTHLSTWLLCLGVLLSSISSYAQFSGNIQGDISDSSGAAIMACQSVFAISKPVSAPRPRATPATIALAAFSQVTIKAEASGFQSKEVNFTLSTGELQGINITLAVGSSSQSVTVTGEAPTLDVDESRIQTTLPEDTVRDLPQLNRNLYMCSQSHPVCLAEGSHYFLAITTAPFALK